MSAEGTYPAQDSTNDSTSSIASMVCLCITSHKAQLMNSWTQQDQENSVLNRGHHQVITLCLQHSDNKTLGRHNLICPGLSPVSVKQSHEHNHKW